MSEKHLHIIAHDVPWPADFGGVVDNYYKIKWLHSLGIKIHLHCFVKNRPPQKVLEKYCETVCYYRRKGISSISLNIPYIISSRSNPELLQNLLKDNYPISFEGIHGTYHLYKNKLKDRKIFIRILNAEFIYYRELAVNELNLFKRFYYQNEARLLKKYEANVARKAHLLPLSMQDEIIFKEAFNVSQINFLPASLPWDNLSFNAGTGTYCLYHGNLSVNENEKAAQWLIENVFCELKIPFIIAGRSPRMELKNLVKKYDHIQLKENPNEAEMQMLVENAQVNVLPSFNKTGLKLKLLNALFNGRHCLVNPAGCEGSGTADLCTIAETPQDFKNEVKRLWNEVFTETKMQHRGATLKTLYNNEQNARRLIAWIW